MTPVGRQTERGLTNLVNHVSKPPLNSELSKKSHNLEMMDSNKYETHGKQNCRAGFILWYIQKINLLLFLFVFFFSP